jgi:hypothetical protein
MMAALVITFLSGASSGILIGRSLTPPGKPTWKDKYIENVKRAGVTEEADLERVRELLDKYDARVQEVKSQLPTHLREQISETAQEIQGEIQAIIDSYEVAQGRPR